MGLLRQIAIAILLLSLVVFIALFGRLPALRSTPISFLYRCIWLHTPRAFRKADQSLTGGRLTIYFSRLSHYLLYEKHPIILIFFLGLLTSASAVFLRIAWPRLSPSPHHILIPILLPLPYLFTYLSVRSRASYITPQNHPTHLRAYPYDHTLYHPNNPCTTCNLAKPARSKHCSICRACIARADHHCVWVNNCLGADNYRWFIALLASLGVVLTYGAVLAYILLRQSPVFRPDGGRSGRGAHRQREMGGARAHLARGVGTWTLALQLDLEVGAVGLLAGLTAPLAWALLAYHLYLVWAGMTTNETGKWADLREDMAEGVVWRRIRNGRSGMRIESEPGAAWPVQSEQFIVKMRLPGEESPLRSDDGRETWELCWSLADLDNLYDVGVWHNLKDALNLR